ncbi:MAG TPA: RDD family protein [Dokdonella sp.]|uniref:RDD family protein n=1 Tax=Dokdonella sp. TaxID=2291710 RepID=UPI002D80E6C0|nr:RDD family protein [Dokdonella sp.]HET9034191.1 RDD family protein [Dokdonella sp.]
MEPIKHALVLTGETQAGFDAANVWSALATYFRMEPDRLKAELLARAPISIKESDDLGKLQRLQQGAQATGAVTELHEIGDSDNLFVLVDGKPCGPVPHAFVDDRVRSGAWPSSISVAVVGSSDWKPFVVPTSAATDLDQQATVAFSAVSPAPASAPSASSAPAPTPAPTPAPRPTPAKSEPAAPDMRISAVTPGAAAVASTATGDPLPEGGIVHAGFWRRFAAYTLDSIILSIPFLLIFGVLGYLSVQSAVSGEAPGTLLVLFYFLAYVGAIVLSWLYFAKFESGASQATPGKRIMGLKVTSTSGERLSFGRATGRFFGKIVTGIIPFGIGWMLAGWTGRKQALHDMMASTCVIFREVEPGKPLPTERPKMPWYGWVLNGLPILGTILMFAGWGIFMSMLMGAMNMGAPNSSMSSSQGMSSPDTTGAIVIPDTDTSMADNSGSGSSGVDENEKAAIRAGLTAVFMVATSTQSEIAAIADGGGDCPTEDRSSNNNWIEAIQLGGISPACTVTIRLSSSSDIPFAARIERIEWTYQGGGSWRCESSMASDLLPFACN